MKVVDVIDYIGDNRTFVQKYAEEDFNTLSTLIVHESQEALLFLNGRALDLFGPGEHVLKTQNIPFLKKMINLPTDGVTPFRCEVYFINKTEQMAINWGMGNVNYLDPTHNNYVFKIGASGEMSLKVSDSRKLVTKLVGTETYLNQDTLKHYFKAPITTHIKTMLPALLRERNLSIFEVESNLTECSEILRNKLSEEMEEYGVTLEKFWISTIVMPEDDPNYKLLNRQRGEQVTLVTQGNLDKQREEINAQLGMIKKSGTMQQEKMDIDIEKYRKDNLGYVKDTTDKAFRVLETFAGNEGSGSDLSHAAMNLGAGPYFGGIISSIANNTLSGFNSSMITQAGMQQPMQTANMPPIPEIIELKEEMSDHKSANNQIENDMVDFQNKIKKLMLAKEAGLVTEEEFEMKRKSLLDSIV